MKRTDIAMKDVFISWTGDDRDMKDAIISFLASNGISCLESDENCSGDFVQWSKDAVGACSLFLLILSENTLRSKYVPIEIGELKALDDWKNRVIPVCTDMELYKNHSWGLNASESAVILNGREITDDHLSSILNKTKNLLIHRQYANYCTNCSREYATLTPLLDGIGLAGKQYSHEDIYVMRAITEVDESGKERQTVDSPEGLIKSNDIIFISGPAGCGKTQYIRQIRDSADNDDLVISLSCANAAQSGNDVITLMYNEFRRITGIRSFYSLDNFKRLLSVKNVVLILDGMDEIATKVGTQKFVRKVDEFYAQCGDNVTVIFTGRNPTDANSIALGGKDVRRFIMNKLTDTQIEQLSENLFLLFGSVELNNEFYIKLKDLDDEIRSNPLLLSQLAIVYQSTGEFPKSVIGICDAVSKITLGADMLTSFDSIPDGYDNMLRAELSSILKAFSRERYNRLSKECDDESVKIFSAILKPKYADESNERARFLVEYLRNRSILIDGKYYHKMFLEYFTAVAYYEQAFNSYDELDNVEAVNDLFKNYSNPYWAAVIKFFLIKADSCVSKSTANELYGTILDTNGICEYTLLFDTCRDLLCHKEQVQLCLVSDILKKSTDGVYPPYGPLFWYVPEYGLYKEAILAANILKGNAKALALVRDVCFIFGGIYSARDITTAVNMHLIFNSAARDLSGIRKALCELFYIGRTAYTDGADIYPRCFNVAEAKSLTSSGRGTIGRYLSPFEDELGLYSHDMINAVDGELCGFIAMPYSIDEVEGVMNGSPVEKIRGLALSPGELDEMKYMHFPRTHLRKLYLPENVQAPALSIDNRWDDYLTLLDNVYCSSKSSNYYSNDGICYMPIENDTALPYGCTKIPDGYFNKRLDLTEYTIPEGITAIGNNAFFACSSLKQILIPEGVTEIGATAFFGCRDLTRIELPSTLTSIEFGAFASCHSLKEVIFAEGSKLDIIRDKAFFRCDKIEEIILPDTVTYIGEEAFFMCTALKNLRLPLSDPVSYKEHALGEGTKDRTCIGRYSFANCYSLTEARLPANTVDLDTRAFVDCKALKSIYLPRGCAIRVMTEIESFTSIDLYFPCGIEDERRLFTYNSDLLDAYNIERYPSSQLIIFRGNKDARNEDTSREHMRKYFENGNTRLDDERIKYTVSKDETVHLSSDKTYANTKQITTAIIDDGVSDIPRNAFMNCIDLKTVHFSREITCITREAFKNCTALCEFKVDGYIFKDGKMRLPSIYHIESGAFEGCKSICELHLTEPLYKIDYNAFAKCESLSVVVLPKTLRYLGDNAFLGCPNLTSITIDKNFKNDIERVFGNIDKSIIKWI